MAKKIITDFTNASSASGQCLKWPFYLTWNAYALCKRNKYITDTTSRCYFATFHGQRHRYDYRNNYISVERLRYLWEEKKVLWAAFLWVVTERPNAVPRTRTACVVGIRLDRVTDGEFPDAHDTNTTSLAIWFALPGNFRTEYTSSPPSDLYGFFRRFHSYDSHPSPSHTHTYNSCTHTPCDSFRFQPLFVFRARADAITVFLASHRRPGSTTVARTVVRRLLRASRFAANVQRDAAASTADCLVIAVPVIACAGGCVYTTGAANVRQKPTARSHAYLW